MTPAYKRWYDHDPKLLEVIELLKNYPEELHSHAQLFLEKLAQKHIPEIFAQDGEAHFRKLEHELIQKYSNYHNQVISTGGGIVENIENINLLKKNGVVFYLSAKIDTLYERVRKATNRPLLKHPNPKERIKELVQKREPFYKMADFEVDTDNKDLVQIVQEILDKYETAA